MPERPLRILKVNTVDLGGGAEQVAWDLFHQFIARGHDAWYAVAQKKSDHARILALPNDAYRGTWARFCLRVGDLIRSRFGEGRLASGVSTTLAYRVGQPRRLLRSHLGHEDFEFPASWHLPNLVPARPDVIHAHNLHGSYFDLRALARLSHRVPVVLTLHDAWTLSGHCAHSFGCERWKTGCGDCPDIHTYPAIRCDATAYNWKRKQAIYRRSRLYVATPSSWLMDKVRQSILASGIAEARVIPYGIDLTVFRPGDRRADREALGIDPRARVLLFAAHPRNLWKDYATIRAALVLASERLSTMPTLFIGLGYDAAPEKLGSIELRYVSHVAGRQAMASYYRAADCYVQSSKADTFPNAVLEALACGTPVIGTAVGGIPEQVRDGQTGFVVPPADPAALADCAVQLLADSDRCAWMADNAARMARRCYDLERHVNDYLTWYADIIRAFAVPAQYESQPDNNPSNVLM